MLIIFVVLWKLKFWIGKMDVVLNVLMLFGNVVRDLDEYRFGSWDIINLLFIVFEKKMIIKIKCLY